jgi:hypothetical protein
MRAFGGESRLAERTQRETRQGLQCVTAIHHIPPKMNLIGKYRLQPMREGR